MEEAAISGLFRDERDRFYRRKTSMHFDEIDSTFHGV